MKKTKKLLAVILSVMILITSMSVFASAATDNLDLAFVVDTTGSMSDDIYTVKQDMKDYLYELEAKGINYRIAIIDYRDFSERTGRSYDYPYCIQLDFTNDYDTIINAVDNLDLGYGGDENETICSALIDGVRELSWDKDSGKAIILMGDAPALDPEPYTGYTKENVTNWLNGREIDYTESFRTSAISTAASTKSGLGKITVFSIATSTNPDTVEDFEYIAQETGGESYIATDSSTITESIEEIIDIAPEIVDTPSFWDKIVNFFLSIVDFITSLFTF